MANPTVLMRNKMIVYVSNGYILPNLQVLKKSDKENNQMNRQRVRGKIFRAGWKLEHCSYS